MSDAREFYWDPYDEDIDVDPYPRWKALRDEVPVYHNERYDFWALSRYADVEFASRQPGQFMSSHGVTLETLSPNPMDTGMMIMRDPPDHTRLRSLVNRAFTPRRVAELEPAIRQYSRDMLAAWEPGADFDLVGQFGSELPSKVISELLGVPEADRDEIHTLIDTVFHIEPGVGMTNDTSLTAMLTLYDYLLKLIATRASDPGDDLLSALTTAEIGDDDAAGGSRSLTEQEMAEFGVLLITAGTETVGKLIGWAGLLLGEHVDQQQYLRETSRCHPERDRGDAPLRAPVARPGPLARRGDRAPRHDDSRRLEDPAVDRRCRSGRAQVRRRRSLRRASRLRSPRVVRVRRPLLPRGGAGATRGSRRTRGDARPHDELRVRSGRLEAGPHQHGPRLGIGRRAQRRLTRSS